MLNIAKRTRTLENCEVGHIPEDISSYTEPVILKGIVKNWEMVELGQRSVPKTVEYLKSFYNGKPTFAYFGAPELQGRYGYNADVTQLNYESRATQIDEVLDLILQHLDDDHPPSYYIASNVIDQSFPKFREHNDLHIPIKPNEVTTEPPVPSIWIGNKSVARGHYDASDNIACCVVGKRRFITFPPDQIENLYPGPLSPTPGGQALTMVDIHNPDFSQYPNYKKAQAAGQVAELEPGDGIFIPSMWWHQVEGLSQFNVLVNYWWSDAPKFMGSAMNVLYHAMLSLRDKPQHEKDAWKHVFNYYIFGDGSQSAAHLPEHARGFLEEMDERKSKQLRSMLLNKLNR
ncbi:cupin-like domain-containing protein [Paraglaciecola arctica]|uniref:cupin-like domain-containing protein n=1 Tax=Paraglaciecola arctica TaxID=1128911 RepID=UPI001C07C957|nr:cupin-like domain-containing protein [Paraglaciecola arctica]MBU3005987.1 cupin-like domain-containing protein [Paraglaciecola arctica]